MGRTISAVSQKVPKGMRYLMKAVPLYRAWLERRLSWTFNDRVHGTLFRDPDFEHPERAVNPINDGHRRAFTRYVNERLAEHPHLIEAVLPDYPPFAKRMLLDNGWFRTLKKPNVQLIADRLGRVEGNGLYASSGEMVEADVIILATRFQTTRVLGSYSVIGREGPASRRQLGQGRRSRVSRNPGAGFSQLLHSAWTQRRVWSRRIDDPEHRKPDALCRPCCSGGARRRSGSRGGEGHGLQRLQAAHRRSPREASLDPPRHRELVSQLEGTRGGDHAWRTDALAHDPNLAQGPLVRRRGGLR